MASGIHSPYSYYCTSAYDCLEPNVYVSKNGQELTGRNAYRHYRKESGSGFKKSKKKTSAKKANAKRN
ncbi:hypothetical protein L195_g056749 [Trifolium pratense]|uniref:Uncharacterized protein n=1 Tax=Trifolium pratense TaxID=57577 RepID=A0A2K3KT78_TRIPR|nr:hypothetical protein L195_g059660 [Trifolium pratense]PNX67875.1 hypothetical protein L195_g055864 [Trifolium pratense]PNX69497.1 hypothetical protein L195_g056749 [Trifolium pratense]